LSPLPRVTAQTRETIVRLIDNQGSEAFTLKIMVPRRKLWVVLGNIESDVAAAVGSNDVAGFGRWSLTGRQDQFCLGHGDRRQALHLAAHRFAAAGLDRDTHGREFCIGAINDAIGSSPRWSGERFGGG